ncbi:DUF1499 domain-containing protein [Rhizobium paknamense]|uniref:DUF1499 domain-containing protein n=1 Tax=Rhizobium paknamense TaxID=1206817 RepID=A0ABU0IAB7_9HYPH|nr:DUF1499 domain-containing protein [Rhizobium paknamense]MDQ0455174.1 hypothetical protein [Rhizobium paknamense]
MTIRYIRPISRAAHLARRIAGFSVLTLVLAWLLYRFGPLQTPNFIALVLISALLAALSVPLALWGLWRLWQIGAEGGVAALKALLLALLPLAVAAFGVLRYENHPRLYELATDPEDPPAWIEEPVAAQRWMPRPPSDLEGNAAVQRAAYPTLTVRRYDGALDRVYQAVRKVAADRRIAVVLTRGADHARPDFQPPETVQPAGPGLPKMPIPLPRPDPPPPSAPDDGEPAGMVRLQAVARHRLLGFPFDLVIRLREEDESVLVDLRIESRYGPHDLGFAAAIANDYLTALDAELLGIAQN